MQENITCISHFLLVLINLSTVLMWSIVYFEGLLTDDGLSMNQPLAAKYVCLYVLFSF